jgi:hypothetical protein
MDLTDTGEVSVPRSHDHLGLLLALLGGLLLAATPSPEPNAPASDDTGSDRPRALDPALDGEQIYERVLHNRFDSFTQESRMSSVDRAGRVQETRLHMYFKNFRDAENLPARGVLSKTLVKYTQPFDLRHSGYLVIQNHARTNDQFVFFPARRQTVRVNLRGEAVFGTDFSFEDVIPREIEDATYQRLPNASAFELPVYVVEARPTELFDSEYSRFRFYVDPESFVPLRTRYWDRAEVEIKELSTRPVDVQHIDGIDVPMKLTMRNLLLESHTTLRVTSLIPNELSERAFEIRRLEAR